MQSKLVKGLAAGALALALAASSVASSVASAEPLAAGTSVPEISVTDQNGAARDLASLTSKKGVVLVFTRSLSW